MSKQTNSSEVVFVSDILKNQPLWPQILEKIKNNDPNITALDLDCM
jgi:hypothetical protein